MRILLFCLVMAIQLPFLLDENEAHSGSTEMQLSSDFNEDILPAADQFFKYQSYLKGKRLGLVVNHTSRVKGTHLVDTLLSIQCKIQKIFAPEHGFRGDADAGETIKNDIDAKTNIPIVSLYGKNKKPSAEQLQGIDLMVFDIQDVGARFYTYTSTMTYIMEACAENKIPLLILDRPNPNGHYIDGPILNADQESFVGLHSVPIVHGLTVAEYARMINEEGWLDGGLKCELYHVECLNYNHSKLYKLPVAPSPNLPNMRSIYLYPSLCLFEGTDVSVGRGTDKQFQLYGSPAFTGGDCAFNPVPKAGAKHPLHEGQLCRGFDLSKTPETTLQQQNQLNLSYLLDFYNKLSAEAKAAFFRKDNFLDLLAGTSALREQIIAGKSQAEIRQSWQQDLERYRLLRRKYLLYKEEGF